MGTSTAKFDADFEDFKKEVLEADDELGKFTMSSEQADKVLKDLSGTTSSSVPGVNSLQQSYKQFDGVLSAAGINIGPVVKGIEDLGLASGKTASQLGALGVAGLAVGTFTIAFQTARGVIDKWFPDLDKAIADNVSSFMGWGDVTAETALATADTLAKASEIAGRAITTMSEALKVINKEQEEQNKKREETKKALEAWTKATLEVTVAAQNHSAILQTINGQTVEAAKFALDHGVSQTSVATAYELTAPQIAAVVEQLKQEKIALEEVARADKATAQFKEAARKQAIVLEKEFARERQAATAIVNAAVIAEMTAQQQLNALYTGPAGAVSALDQYNAALTRLRATKVEGVALTQQEALLDKQLADALLAEAQAADQASAAMRGHNDALHAAVPAAQAAIGATRQAQNAMGVAGSAISSVDAFGRPVISPFLSGLPVDRGLDRQIFDSNAAANWNRFAGQVTVNYPIMDDPQALNQLSGLIGRAIGQQATKAGRSPV